MLELLKTPLRFIVLFALLAAAFAGGRALAEEPVRVTNKPLILTNLSNDRVCGRPADGTSQEITCYPDASEIESVLVKPSALAVSKAASCALDENEWKCWGTQNSAVNPQQLQMVTTDVTKASDLLQVGESICKVDRVKGIVSCSLNYGMSKDPLRMKSSLAPSKVGDHFGPFPKLGAVAGQQGFLCFIDDDVLKCATDNTRPRPSERKLKNATLLAVGAASVCTIDETGNRCFSSFGETKAEARPSWKGAKKLVAYGTDLCTILSTNDVECLSLGGSGPLATALIGNIPADLGPVLDLGLGKNFACALRQDRSVRCWSNGSAVGFMPPRELTNVSAISVAEAHACALEDSGDVVCWGANDRGQTLPPLRGGSPIRVAQSGSIKCAWNSSGARCTDSYAYSSSLPDVVSKMPSLKGVVTIALSPGYAKTACAITKTESGTKATCWGAQPEIVNAPELLNPKSLSLGDETACAITGNESAQCWGKPTGMPWNVVPKNVSQIDVANDRFCMIDYFGFVCWGEKLSASPLATPEKFKNNYEVEEFALGQAHTCVRTKTEVECWGGNDSSQLQVPPMVEPISLIANGDVTCASDRDGVVCWGPNFGISGSVPPVSRPGRHIPEHTPP